MVFAGEQGRSEDGPGAASAHHVTVTARNESERTRATVTEDSTCGELRTANQRKILASCMHTQLCPVSANRVAPKRWHFFVRLITAIKF